MVASVVVESNVGSKGVLVVLLVAVMVVVETVGDRLLP